MIMSRNHKVMHISCLHPWNDTRILFREAKTLSKEHDVELHAVADFKTRVYEGVIIVGLRKKKIWLRPIQWFILGWRSLRNSATVVHLHDPELLLLGLVLCFFGKKVIYDVHEDVYEDILNKDWIPKPLRLIIAKIYLFFHKLSDIQLSAIVTATPTIAKQFHNRQLVVVRNYPPLDVYSNNGQDFTSRKMHYPVRLIYVGTINRTRGVLNIVRALHHIPKGFEYRLDIVGSFADGKNFEIEVMEAAAVFSNNIFFHGRLEFPQVLKLMAQAHVGLVCTQPTVNDLAGIPLKLFEYMSAGLGVIISDFPSWYPYLEKYPPHEFVDSTKPEDIARGIIKLVNNWNSFDTIWEQARTDIMSSYNWHTEGIKLTNLYKSI